MRPRFRIGDYVQVKATTETTRTYGEKDDPTRPWQTRECYKKLRRKECATPLLGWIVGAVRRHEGCIKGQRSEDGDQPYLVSTKSVLLWEVAQSMMNAPLEAADADVQLVSPYANAMPPYPPMRLGVPWSADPTRSEKLRAAQREDMVRVPRDAKGRWLVKPLVKHERGVEELTGVKP